MRAFSCLTIASYLGLSALAGAGTTSVNTFHSSDFTFSTPISNEAGVALTQGDAPDGDGAVIQLGIFVGVDTALDPASYTEVEWATFRPLTGLGSRNPFHDTTIGDGGGGQIPDGFYTFGVTFDDFSGNANPPRTPDSGLDGTPARIGIRYYDTQNTPTSSTPYNTVSVAGDFWVLAAPGNPAPPPAGATMDGNQDDLVWQSGPSGAFRTVIPEPSSTLLSLLGTILLLRRRRLS